MTSRGTPRTPRYSRRLDDALALAADAFRDRVRKQTDVPYLTHLLQVMVTVAEHGGDEDQMIAALLHDYLEDIEGARAEAVEQRFGQRVSRMVEALSDTTEPSHKAPWEGRKQAYISRLVGEPAEVKLICAADKLHNAHSICRDLKTWGDEVWSRFKPSKERMLWYFREVIVALEEGWSDPLLEELRAEVRLMHEAAGVPYGDD